MKNLLVSLLLFCSTSAAYAQALQPNWEDALQSELAQFKACEQEMVNNINTCNQFIGKTLKTVYKVNDFYAADLGRHMIVSEMATYLEESGKWSLLGHAYEQTALNQAQANANKSKAVVALYLNEEGIGLISLILPGELNASGTWGFRVPNSAAFFISDPEKSYVGKGLSYSFDRSLLKDVKLYSRNY